MASPYSDDLRQKAIDTVDRGERKSHVCRMLNISRNTLDLWLKRREATGLFSTIVTYHRGPQLKIADLEAFRAFAQRFCALKLGHRTRRISMIAGWCEGEVLAPMTFEGNL